MNLFQKIKESIQQKIALNKVMEDLKDFDEVLLEKRLEIFREEVTPKFAKIGLSHWNGKYLWFSDFNEDGVKHVVEYNVFKIYGGSFSYGNCFASVPTISGKKLVNHRTDKSTKIHFFKRLDGWQRSIERNSRNNPDRISTINEQQFRDSLDDVMARNLPKLKRWFETFETLDQNIAGLQKDVENPPYSVSRRIVSCEHILGFLYKQKEDLESAEAWLQKHFHKNLNTQEEMELLTKRLKG